MKGISDQFAKLKETAVKRAEHGLGANPLAIGAECTPNMTACQPLEVRRQSS